MEWLKQPNMVRESIGGFSPGIKYYKFVEMVLKIGVSLLRCDDNCNILIHSYIYIHTRRCVCVCMRESHSPAVIVTNVAFSNVHDNNLDGKVLYYAVGFIFCDKPGSST